MVYRSGAGWTFELYHGLARYVEVVGDIRDGHLHAISMTPCGNGWWTLSLSLVPGVYRFRYRVDHSHWLTDWAAFGVEMNKSDGWVALLYVPQDIDDLKRELAHYERPAELLTDVHLPEKTA